jgi:hypothetical protein
LQVKHSTFALTSLAFGVNGLWDVVLVFVDNHYNKYAQLESQTIREAGRSSHSVGRLAAEFVGPEKGNCIAVSWLQSLLALKRAVVRSG